MVELFVCCLVFFILLFYYMFCDYFGLYYVKVGCNKIIKYYGVIFICLNIRVVYLEFVVDSLIMEFI